MDALIALCMLTLHLRCACLPQQVYLTVATTANPTGANSVGGGELRGQLTAPKGSFVSTAAINGPNADGTLPTDTATPATCPVPGFTKSYTVASGCNTQATLQVR